MKTLLLFLGILFMTGLTGFTQERYKITGNVAGLPDGKLFLVVPTTEGVKTLGETDVVNGTFTFEGSVKQGCVALIKTADQEVTIPVMLENTDIKITVDQGRLFITGGGAQQLYNRYIELMHSITAGQNSFKTEFEVAMKMKDQNRMRAIQDKCDQYVKQGQRQEMAWIKEHGNHFVAAYVVASTMDQLDYEELQARYDLLGFGARASFYGQLVMVSLARQKTVAVGEIAPDFVVKKWEGDSISLYGVQGKVKLLHFWSSGNSVCRQENVELLKIYNKYHSKGFEIFSISLDDNKQVWKKAILEDGMIWKNGSDLKGPDASEIVRLYFVKNIPHSLLLDADNRIVAKDLSGKSLQKKIAELLKL